jgi:hypothetical protein
MIPAPNAPGSLLEELTAIKVYLDLPIAYRRRWRQSAIKAARAAVMDHCREPHPLDLRFSRRTEAGKQHG